MSGAEGIRIGRGEVDPAELTALSVALYALNRASREEAQAEELLRGEDTPVVPRWQRPRGRVYGSEPDAWQFSLRQR
ncbi:hypothetical protein KRX56_08790 [Dermabacteraceae bacterium TAE3-ERU27]|nr:hypothetical protein [Dermabacteraceae bacterium TAE3-ERU27]